MQEPVAVLSAWNWALSFWASRALLSRVVESSDAVGAEWINVVNAKREKITENSVKCMVNECKSNLKAEGDIKCHSERLARKKNEETQEGKK